MDDVNDFLEEFFENDDFTFHNEGNKDEKIIDMFIKTLRNKENKIYKKIKNVYKTS